MLKAIRTRIHLTPSTVIATLALVFAMTGGAYAAKHYLITSTKQISPKVLKSLAGKAGKVGPAGANGANGAQGPAGAAGVNGKDGAQGLPGKDGAAGAKGDTGATGNPGPLLATLPPGKTLKGEWNLGGPEGAIIVSHVTFQFPLSAQLTASHVHYITPGGKERVWNTTTNHEEEKTSHPACEGSATEPTAEEGNLCVYANQEENTLTSAEAFGAAEVLPLICSYETAAKKCLSGLESTDKSAGRFGFGILGVGTGAPFHAGGTWAVTAE